MAITIKDVARESGVKISTCFEIMCRRSPGKCGDVRDRFNVIDAATVPIVRSADEQSETLAGAKSLSDRTCSFHKAASAENGSVSTHAADVHRGTLASGLGDQIHGAANAIAIHVGL